jgi:uncharacterized membrane protein
MTEPDGRSPRERARDQWEQATSDQLIAVALITLIGSFTVVMGFGILLGWAAARVAQSDVPAAPKPLVLVQN